MESDVTDGKLVLTPTIKFLALRDEYFTTTDISLSSLFNSDARYKLLLLENGNFFFDKAE